MLADARHTLGDEVIDTDVCIIGAGPAGIVLARTLGASGVRVCLLEGGGLAADDATQALYRGRVVGQRYFQLDDCRARQFGGAANWWGGWSRAMDPINFEARDWVPHSGWPIPFSEVDRFSDRTRALLQIPSVDDALAAVAQDRSRRPLPLPVDEMATALLQFSPLVDFSGFYREELFAAPTVTTLLHANVVGIDRDPDGTAIRRVRVATLSGRRGTVEARVYILAAGAIENARLLLASAIGTDHDVVGRYFGEHPHVRCGVLETAPGVDAAFYDETQRRGREPMGWFVLPPSVQRAHRLLAFSASLRQRPPMPVDRLLATQASGFTSSKALMESVLLGRGPARWSARLPRIARGAPALARGIAARTSRSAHTGRLFEIKVRSEQTPNPESRVRLNATRDRLGVPMVDLDWRLVDADRATVREGVRLLAAACATAGIGRVSLPADPDDAPSLDGVGGGWHQMGTTRMADNPRVGVVDAHCRVHGVPNLFVAGSSVFPAYGFANPTFTILSLALRLADHVAGRLSAVPAPIVAASHR